MRKSSKFIVVAGALAALAVPSVASADVQRHQEQTATARGQGWLVHNGSFRWERQRPGLAVTRTLAASSTNTTRTVSAVTE